MTTAEIKVALAEADALLDRLLAGVSVLRAVRRECSRLGHTFAADIRTDAELAAALVAPRFGVRPESLFSRARPVPVVDARFALIWLLRHHHPARLSLEAIGVALGRDHGAVSHALRAAEARRETEPRYAGRLDDLAREAVHLWTKAAPSQPSPLRGQPLAAHD